MHSLYTVMLSLKPDPLLLCLCTCEWNIVYAVLADNICKMGGLSYCERKSNTMHYYWKFCGKYTFCILHTHPNKVKFFFPFKNQNMTSYSTHTCTLLSTTHTDETMTCCVCCSASSIGVRYLGKQSHSCTFIMNNLHVKKMLQLHV